jgi:hypothetical protein
MPGFLIDEAELRHDCAYIKVRAQSRQRSRSRGNVMTVTGLQQYTGAGGDARVLSTFAAPAFTGTAFQRKVDHRPVAEVGL